MMFFTFCLGFHLIKVPFDIGANKVGAALAPDLFQEHFESCDSHVKTHSIEIGTVRKTLGNTFLKTREVLNQDAFPLIVGGDHTIAMASVAASNQCCQLHQEKLGVLWIDAHADFNTMESSITKNIHGMPVAVLCGHTLPLLSFSILEPHQFGFMGVRDMDEEESKRFEEYDMCRLSTLDDLLIWCEKFDKIHISFDIDAVDPKEIACVSTPVEKGLALQRIMDIFKLVKDTKKIISMDLVEYNPKMAASEMNLKKEVECIQSVLNLVL